MRLALIAAFVCAATPALAAADPTYEYKDPSAPPPPAPVVRTSWKANMTFGLVWVDDPCGRRVPQSIGAERNVDYHSARLFFYYENKFTRYASVTEGVELLEAFNHFEGFRLNSITTLSSQIYKNVALKVNFTLH